MSNRDINFNAGYSGCNDKVAILKNETIQRDLTQYPDTDPELEDSYVYVDQNGKPTKIALATVMSNIPVEDIQSDWNVEDPNSYKYIANKPDIDTVLDKDLVSLYNIGGVYAGQVFRKNTLIRDIIIELLSSSKDGTLKLFVTDFDPNEITLDQIQAISNNSAPAGFYQYIVTPQTAAELLENGYKWKDVSLENQYYMLAIPQTLGVIVDDVIQGGFVIEYDKTEIRNDEGKLIWILYHDLNKVTGTYTFKYIFKEGELK